MTPRITGSCARLAQACTLVAAVGTSTVLPAQTDYYNTDAGRPVQIEDAYPTERYAFELQLAPVRLERAVGGVYTWGVEPEIAYGILPRTHVEIGAPLTHIDAGPAGRTTGLAGIDISLLHNLNVETATLPAFGVAARVLFPAGGLGPDGVHASVKGIATRTFSFARFHLNAEYTFGPEGQDAPDDTGTGTTQAELSRWLVGVAADRALPLQSMLLIGELYAQDPLLSGEDVEWNIGAGVRYQLDPRFALDGGLGRRLTGDAQAWFVTFGAAYAFSLPFLFPRAGR